MIAVLAILVVVAFVLLLASMLPSKFRVERSILVAAPPDRITPLIENLHYWKFWSPWAHLDPTMTVTYSGPISGPGAVYEWAGNRKVGQGRMEVLSAEPLKVALKLDFMRPVRGHNSVEFLLVPAAHQTRVTWVMSGPKTLGSKVVGMVLSIDQMIGSQFEAGLSALKGVAETAESDEALLQRIAV